MDTAWFVYILECSDRSLYTGVTTSLARRLREHNLGKGAKYTRSRKPCILVYASMHPSRSEAQIKEAYIRKFSHNDKYAVFINGSSNELRRIK